MTTDNSILIQKAQSSQLVSGEGFAPVAEFLQAEKEIFVVYDRNVSDAAEKLMGTLREISGGALRGSMGIEATEEGKSMETVLSICRSLLEADASRHAFLLALGGGITTDLTGFVAATYKRGIRYGNIPTTLLAQVDAAIGGKTGVNLDGYKNMVGAFHLPQFTYLSADVLETLPPAIFREGISELLKTFLIADGAVYEAACRFFAKAQNEKGADEKSTLLTLIRRAAQIKANIVQRDPFEAGERAKLNLGHTFAHAIEHEAALRGEQLSHGEAVGIGTLLAARLSERLGVAEKGLTARLKADYQSIGLSTESPYPVQGLLPAMGKDKKAAGGRVKFVLPVRPGEVVLEELSMATVDSSLRSE